MAELRPQPGPQTRFFESPADIVVYGGGAGAGKSFALLMECVRHVGNARFGAVVFRRDKPQITNEGGLWDEAGLIYPALGGESRRSLLDYQFTVAGRPGGRVSFRSLEHEKTKYKWQGAQIPLLCFDELTHFSESQFFYLLSRNRTVCGVKPYVRCTTNPDAGSWVKRLLAPWVDRKFAGVRARSGEIRWFVRIQGRIEWGQTPEDIAARFGPRARPKSITFIKATIHDNPILLAKDPEYLANLEAQNSVERARLLDGDWDVVNEGLVYPEFGTCVVEIEDWPAKDELVGPQVGGIDWGFRHPFAAPLAVEDLSGVLWVHWLRYATRATPTEHSLALPRDLDNPPRWWADPSQPSLIAELRSADHDVIACTHQGHQPIKSGIAVVTQRIREGTLKIRGDLGELIDEAGKYRYPEANGTTRGDGELPVDRDNHAMDALRYLIQGHDRGRVVHDQAPPEGQDRIDAREEAEDAADRQRREAFYSIENDHFFGR